MSQITVWAVSLLRRGSGSGLDYFCSRPRTPVPQRQEEIRAVTFRHRLDCRGDIVFTRLRDKHLSRVDSVAGGGSAGERPSSAGGFSTSGSHVRCLLASSLVHYQGGGTAYLHLSLRLVVGRGRAAGVLSCPGARG